MSDITSHLVRPNSIAELTALVGTELGPTDWVKITQQDINAFADASGDHQWIHVDLTRAAASPLGSTIAHGLLTLSFSPRLMTELMSFESFEQALNYGYNKVRFPAPLPVDSRLRMKMHIASVDDLGTSAQLSTVQVFEREGQEKPVCVVEALTRVVSSEV